MSLGIEWEKEGRAMKRLLMVTMILLGILLAANLPASTEQYFVSNESLSFSVEDEKKTFEMINALRKSSGAAPLQMDSRITSAARGFSREMKEKKNLDDFNDRVALRLLDEGVFDPYPKTFVAQADFLEDILKELKNNQKKTLTDPLLSHGGIGIVRSGNEYFFTLILTERMVEIEPFPVFLLPDETVELQGKLMPGYKNPRIEMTLPTGDVVSRPVKSKKDAFTASIPMNEGEGQYIVEMIVDSPLGPKVAALMPVSVGLSRGRFTERDKKPQYDSTEDAEKAMAEMINYNRHLRGLSKLMEDQTLAEIARTHSADMAKNDFFGHISPTRGDLRERIKSYNLKFFAIGENIALDDTVEHADAELLKSPGHRKNVFGDFTHVGVGIVKKDGKLYITQVYIKKGEAAGKP